MRPHAHRSGTARRARTATSRSRSSPGIAHDTEATIEQAQRFHDEIDKPNLYVKIPATAAGVPAIEEMIARGKRINVTLIFGLDRYAEVAEAYIRGLERLVESGGDPKQVTSVASFFVSRVDTEADKRLDAIGGHDHLKGRLAIANAKLAYQRYKELFSGPRWEALAARGASTQRCLWASTSTKNPEYRDVMYVEELIGPETVNTMPRETIEAFQDHGEVRLDARGGSRRGAQALRRARGGRRGLRRRDEGARGGGRAEVRRLLRRAARGRRREAGAARSGLSTLAPAELVERIWERDPSVWTGRDEAQWLGWLDEPARMRERAHELLEFATRLEAEVDDVVLMGMGGSSLAPEVMRRVLRRGALSRPRHDAPDGDPAARGADRRRPDALRRRLEVGDDARDALPRRLLPQDRVGASRSSPTPARRWPSSPTTSSTASRRSAGATRRCRCSDCCRRR